MSTASLQPTRFAGQAELPTQHVKQSQAPRFGAVANLLTQEKMMSQAAKAFGIPADSIDLMVSRGAQDGPGHLLDEALALFKTIKTRLTKAILLFSESLKNLKFPPPNGENSVTLVTHLSPDAKHTSTIESIADTIANTVDGVLGRFKTVKSAWQASKNMSDGTRLIKETPVSGHYRYDVKTHDLEDGSVLKLRRFTVNTASDAKPNATATAVEPRPVVIDIQGDEIPKPPAANASTTTPTPPTEPSA
ncbi:MAG: hypothetical protein VKJ06_04875 [Vampirovibrionales bacterium]|nr:hypothetical protein [Vampirovibrionales bacterium]